MGLLRSLRKSETFPSRKRRRLSKLQNVTFLKLFLSTPSLKSGAGLVGVAKIMEETYLRRLCEGVVY